MAKRIGDGDTPGGRESFLSAGVDVGTRSVKIAIFDHAGGLGRVVATSQVLVQGRRDTRDARVAIREAWMNALREGAVAAGDVANIASTGTRARGVVHVGHFYRRLAVTLGAKHLVPLAAAVLDVGVTQVRCFRLGDTAEGKRKATRRLEICRGGEMLEHLARRSGLTLDELSLVPGAVWVYDNLIELVRRLLRRLSLEGPTVLVGGMTMDTRFRTALRCHVAGDTSPIELLVSPEGLFAGAYGAALLAARRYRRLGMISRAITIDEIGGPVVGAAAEIRDHIKPRRFN